MLPPEEVRWGRLHFFPLVNILIFKGLINMYLTGIRTYIQLYRNLKKSLDQLKAEQWEAFCNLVNYAYLNVPFYRDLYDRAGFSPNDLKTPDDLASVPVTRKRMFQQSDLKQLLAQGLEPQKLICKPTSGSSGSPLSVYYTPEDRIYRTLLHLRPLLFNGMTLRDRMAHISGNRHPPDYRYLFQKLGFLPKEFVYAADPPDKQLDILKTIEPAVIYSYASSMVLLASEVETRSECPIQPKLVFTTGELLNPDDRELINRAFSVRLRDIYGLIEMSDVAWQCPECRGYHLSIDSFLAEVRPDDGEKAGQLIITNLHSRAMPFIRYEMDDMVTPPNDDPCPCGCPFPMIDVIRGRADDYLYSADGKKVSPLIFVIASIPGVMQYRIIQNKLDHLMVEILPGPGFDNHTSKKVKAHVLEVMGNGLRVDVQPVDNIPKQSGKLRRVISKIEHPNHE